MSQKHIQSAAMALNPPPHDAVDYARRAAEERRRAAEAANEVLASVHESLAVRFAARATESALAGEANTVS
jgi:hypothetical protein